MYVKLKKLRNRGQANTDFSGLQEKVGTLARRLPKFAILVTITSLGFLSGTLSAKAHAAAYYVSPTGSNSYSGTSTSAPWQTFAFAISKLQAGDTVILRNGTYNSSNSGYPNIMCNSNAVNGTAAQPITLKAENERQAFIKGDGSVAPFIMKNCAYWIIEGLRVENGDFSGEPGDVDGMMIFKGTANLTIKRNLVQFSNRYNNESLMYLRSDNTLLEENECYSFKRYCMDFGSGANNIIRRNYANSRGYSGISGGYPSAYSNTRGDGAFSFYGGSGPKINNIIENNISEGNAIGFHHNALYNTDDGSKLYGNISLNDLITLLTGSGSDPSLDNVKNMLVQEFVGIGAQSGGMSVRATHSITLDRVTLLNSAGVGFYADLGSSSSEVGDGSYTINGKNMLVVGSSQSGFRITSAIQTWSLDSADSYNNGTNYNSPSSGQCTNCTNYQTTDPQLGLCKVWIPTGSPMKRTGQNGMDIGANILYRYQNGILTTQPLWDPVAGRFPCGAIMAGVNDISGASCSNVHQRLNVNTNGCSFPPSYRQQSGTVAPPQNFRISGVQ